jgi:membrane-bound ClpP family serine protease
MEDQVTMVDTTIAAPPADRHADAESPELSQPALELLTVPELSFALFVLGATMLACCLALELTLWPWLSAAGLLCISLGILATVPTTPAGFMLLGCGVASMMMEVLFYPGMGLHALGAAFSLSLAGLYLTEPWPGVHPVIATLLGLASGAAVFLTARRSPRCAREDPLASSTDLTGHRATVLQTDGLEGNAVVNGEFWLIHAQDAFLRSGEEVRVTSCTEDHLNVRPIAGPRSIRGSRRRGQFLKRRW